MIPKTDVEKRNEVIKAAHKTIQKREHDRNMTKSAAVSKIIADMKEILKNVD